jgi:hypothetical protein
MRLYVGWRAAVDAADGANYRALIFLQSARVCKTCLRVHTDCKLHTFTFTFAFCMIQEKKVIFIFLATWAVPSCSSCMLSR